MAGIPEEVMHSLDSSVEEGLLTADVHAYLTCLDPDPVGWHDSLHGEHFFQLMSATARQRLAAWRETADLDDRAVLTWIGIHELPRMVTESGRNTLTAAIKLRGPNHAGVTALLDDRAFITENARPFLPNMRELSMRARDDISIMGQAAFAEGRNLVDAFQRRIYEARMTLVQEASRVHASQVLAKHEPRHLRKARRKPLAKAMDLLANIAGRNTASAFLHGEDVTVTGKRFNFRARKGVMTSTGHGALNLTVTDKDNVELVDLCFYFEHSPAPDQLAALILHVKAGNEEDIIMTGNTIRSHPAAAAHAPLKEVRDRKSARNAVTHTAPAEGDYVSPRTGRDKSDRLGNAMSRHVDGAIYGGRTGSHDYYLDFHDTLVPEIGRRIMEVAAESKAGQYMARFAPEAFATMMNMLPARGDGLPEIAFDLDRLPMPTLATPARALAFEP